jgi:UDP-N-acetylmuramoyl-L-alanyl-D-glutamate--2,6-diaminopimelate ligase
MDLSTIKEGLMDVEYIPGRLEFLRCGQKFWVIVDYAHTPGALEAVLLAIRGLFPRRLITVFGCGGERDRGKRPLMGEVASRLSDIVILTNDNPRWEDPISIIKDIEMGIKSKNYRVIEDRREAIKYALMKAKEKDAVLIAGKGHEDYQIIGDSKVPFDDRKVVRSILEGRG